MLTQLEKEDIARTQTCNCGHSENDSMSGTLEQSKGQDGSNFLGEAGHLRETSREYPELDLEIVIGPNKWHLRDLVFDDDEDYGSNDSRPSSNDMGNSEVMDLDDALLDKRTPSTPNTVNLNNTQSEMLEMNSNANSNANTNANQITKRGSIMQAAAFDNMGISLKKCQSDLESSTLKQEDSSKNESSTMRRSRKDSSD